MRLLLTRKQWTIIGIIAAVLACLVMFTFCSPIKAAEHDAAYYQRTGTQPPGMGGEFFMPISARYINDLGGGIGLGYQWKSSGVMLLGQVTYDQFNAVSGTTPFRVGCVDYAVPYTTGSSGHRGIEFTVAVPLRKATKPH
jgi:hypothetical protein